MTKEFQIYYGSDGWRIFPYYLGFESLLSAQLLIFHNAIYSQCLYKDQFCLQEYLNVSLETQFRKFRFYLDLFNNSTSVEFPGLVIANCNLLYDKDKIIKNLNLNFDLDDPLLFSKIRKELIAINSVERI